MIRPRRNRRTLGIRALVRESTLAADDLILPVFVHDGPVTAIDSMPGVVRHDLASLVATAREAFALGIPAIALFAKIPDAAKDPQASAARDPHGLHLQAIAAVKAAVPELLVIADVALDPYSSDGHDGLVVDGEVANDATLPLLAELAVAQARAGADLVAPSDMMDGRVGVIRRALDDADLTGTGILSYAVKYASAFYGPFRDALDSAPRRRPGIPVGKHTYQMDPANVREALREVALDEAEGADLVMVKPGLPYLDVVRAVREATTLPVAVYHVSGEYAMLRAASERGWLNYEACLLETLTGFRRAGADMILTYGALDAARLLRR